MKLRDEPERKRCALARALFDRAVEHTKELGLKVKVQHTRGFTDFHTGKLIFEAVKVLMLAALMTLPASAGTLKTYVTLMWDPPTNLVYSVTNGTTIETFTNTVDSYSIYASTNVASNTTNWPKLMTIPGMFTSVNINMTAQMSFFAVTASNYWGESDFSNVAWTPPPPSDEVQLRVK